RCRAIQGCPRRGHIRAALRRASKPGDGRVATIQAERRPERESGGGGSVGSENRAARRRPSRGGPPGGRSRETRPAPSRPRDVAGGRRLDPGRRIPVWPPGGLEGLKGATTLSDRMNVALGCRAMDDLLGGGVEVGCITVLHGEAGSEKSNCCA